MIFSVTGFIYQGYKPELNNCSACTISLAFSLLTLLDADVSQVGEGHEGGLWQGILQGEEFVLGDGVGAGLEHGPGSNGGEVVALWGEYQPYL